LTLTAVPTKESFNTTFVLDYWTDGIKDHKAKVFTELAAHKAKTTEALEEGGPASLPIVPIAAGAGGLVLIIICCCIMKKCKKKNDVDNQENIYQNQKDDNTDENTIDPFTTDGKKNLKNL